MSSLEGFSSLHEMFARQDGVVAWHKNTAPAAYDLIERGLILGMDITLFVNEGAVLEARKAKSSEVSKPETICINLLHGAWSSLVNAARLSLYGAHVDALSLVRNAFEAACHADNFRDHPADALEWDQFTEILDLKKRRRHIESFERAKKVRATVGAKYPGEDMERPFTELSTYGTHTNPATVAGKLVFQLLHARREGGDELLLDRDALLQRPDRRLLGGDELQQFFPRRRVPIHATETLPHWSPPSSILCATLPTQIRPPGP